MELTELKALMADLTKNREERLELERQYYNERGHYPVTPFFAPIEEE